MTFQKLIILFFVISVISISVGADNKKKDPMDVSVQIDHIIVGISGLKKGMDQFEKLSGVRPSFGGEHPGYGTHNALVSLGENIYLEIISTKPGIKNIFFKDSPELTPLGWAASTDNITRLKEKLLAKGFKTTDPVKSSRFQQNGSKLEWKTVFISEPEIKGAPFFIEWSKRSVHPAETAAKGCKLKSLELYTSDAEKLKELLKELDLNIKVTNSSSTAVKITMKCPKGDILLSSAD